MVAIEGVRGTPASCTTPVAEGMVVHTQTDEIARIRKGVMELYISDHPLDCLTCAANGGTNCRTWPVRSACAKVRFGRRQPLHAARGGRSQSNTGPRTSPTPISPSIRRNASSVRAAYTPATRCRAPFALTIEGRGFDNRVSAGMAGDDFLSSDCVSCGACVQVCPTATLIENKVIEIGTPEHIVKTTCAYCGVGCSFDVHMQGEEVVRMVPRARGRPIAAIAASRGRFAWGYTTHQDRQTRPMIRERITDPWRVVSWDEALDFAVTRLRKAQADHGRDSIGVITSSRCTNEDLSGPEADAGGVRQQQHRYLRAGLPFADRLRAEDGLRHLGGDA